MQSHLTGQRVTEFKDAPKRVAGYIGFITASFYNDNIHKPSDEQQKTIDKNDTDLNY